MPNINTPLPELPDDWPFDDRPTQVGEAASATDPLNNALREAQEEMGVQAPPPEIPIQGVINAPPMQVLQGRAGLNAQMLDQVNQIATQQQEALRQRAALFDAAIQGAINTVQYTPFTGAAPPQAAPPEPTPPKVNIPDALIGIIPTTLAVLLLNAPNNKTSRLLAQNYVPVPIPDSITTSDELFKFIIEHAPKPVAAIPMTFDVDMNHSRNTYGTCNWSQREIGYETLRFTRDDLEGIAGDFDTWDDFVEAIREEAEDRSDSENVNFEGSGDTEHDAYETSDSDDYRREFADSSSGTSRALREYLRQHHPDILRRFEG